MLADTQKGFLAGSPDAINLKKISNIDRYLSDDVAQLRKLRFLAKLKKLNRAITSSPLGPWFELGDDYETQTQYSLAVICYKRSRNKSALFNLALLHVKGHLTGIPNYVEAAACYKEAGELGHSRAWYNLGCLHNEGKLTGTSNYPEAAECYKKAGELGHSGSWFNLGLLHQKGYLAAGTPNYPEAAACYKEAGELGHSDAWRNLGCLHAEGKLTGTLNYPEAAKCYKKAGELGHSGSWFDLGCLHNEGKLTGTSNYPEAAECYKRAGELKKSDAWFNLAILHEDGKLTGTSNYPEAAECYKKAGELGHSDSWFNLGLLNEDGRLTGMPSYSEAAKHYRESGTVHALIRLFSLYKRNLLNLKEDKLTGIIGVLKTDILKKIDQEKEAEKHYYLGQFYEENNEYEEALIHYSESASQGHIKAFKKSKYVQEVFDRQNKLNKLTAEVAPETSLDGSGRSSAIAMEEEELDQDSSSDSEEELKESTHPGASAVTIAEPIVAHQASSTFVQIPSVSYQEKRKLTKEQKIVKEKDKLQQAIKKAQEHSMSFKSVRMQEDKEEPKPLPVEYLNKNVETDYKSFVRISRVGDLVTDISLNPFYTGKAIGKPEVLTGAKHEKRYQMFSRRINDKDRLVYTVTQDKVVILQCGEHYDD